MTSALPLLAGAGGGGLRDWKGLQSPCNLERQQFFDTLGLTPLSTPAVLQVAQRAYATPYPPHWVEEVDHASGALYFYHALRDESSWQHPLHQTFKEILAQVERLVHEKVNIEGLARLIESSLFEAQERAAKELADWVGPLGEEHGGDPYYYNRVTEKTEWEDPREPWMYELHVRYDLLVGFLVAEERNATAVAPTFRGGDLTPTLTSIASTLTSISSTLTNSLTAPTREERNRSMTATESETGCWARPRTPRFGNLPLPPRATSPSKDARKSTSSPLFTMPPHQQRYNQTVLRTPALNASGSFGGSPKNGGPVQPVPPPLPPPPPPAGAPPRW